MSGPSENNGRAELPEDGSGVLANLPRTRPQRASARRAAARAASPQPKASSSSANGGVVASAKRARKPKTAKPKAAVTPKAAAKPKTTVKAAAKQPAVKPRARATARPARAAKVVEEVPRQGFECYEERATGSVQPPGGVELIGTAAEMLNEIAKAGLSGGERLLKDVLSRLSR